MYFRFIFTFQNYDNRVNRWRPPRTGCRDRIFPAITCRHTHRPGVNDPDRATAISSRIRHDLVAGIAWQTPHTLSTITMRTTGPITTWTSTWPAIQLRGAAWYRSKIQWPQLSCCLFLLKRVQIEYPVLLTDHASRSCDSLSS